jgi:hypothetical protein
MWESYFWDDVSIDRQQHQAALGMMSVGIIVSEQR